MSLPSARLSFVARIARAAAAFGLALALTAPAPAQFGEAAGFGEMMNPYFLRRDLVIFSDGLELDGGQSAILESLFWDYEEEHEAGRKRMLDQLQSMRDAMENMEREQILNLVFAPFEQRSVEWEDLRTRFLENVRAILNRQQNDRWQEFRRQLRREKELTKGRLSGENVDLFLVLKMLDLEPAVLAPVQNVLREYDVALDDALVRRESLMHDSRVAMMTSIKMDNPSDAVSIYERQIDTRIAVRNTNDQYRDAIAALLPYEIGAQFRDEALQRAYPRVFRPTAAQRLFAEIKKLTDLSPELMQAVVDLESAYLAELSVINESILQLIRSFEPEEAAYRAASFAARAGEDRPARPKDPTRPEFQRRDDLDRRYASLLRDLLTPDQFAKLQGADRFLRRVQDEKADAAEASTLMGGSTGNRPKKRSAPKGPSVGSGSDR